MFKQRLKWALKVLRSKSYIVLTDDDAVISLPILDVDSFDDRFILNGQTNALKRFKEALEGIISEHDNAKRLMEHRDTVREDREKAPIRRKKTTTVTKK